MKPTTIITFLLSATLGFFISYIYRRYKSNKKQWEIPIKKWKMTERLEEEIKILDKVKRLFLAAHPHLWVKYNFKPTQKELEESKKFHCNKHKESCKEKENK